MVDERRVLIVGAGFSGLMAARHLKGRFKVTIVDAKEYFEYTPGILRAYVKPSHFDSLSFTLAPVLEQKMGIKFIWGEVTNVDAEGRCATIKPMHGNSEEVVSFDYCILANGCNFNPFHKWGQSLWFPTVHAEARPNGDWPHIDERYIEGRRRHIIEEYEAIKQLNTRKARVLIVGAGFIGVEWATELQYYFPGLDLTIIDFLPKCLGPLPNSAATYCESYMKRKGIHCYWGKKYDPNSAEFMESIGFNNGSQPDKTYVCVGIKASNYMIPKECLNPKGPGGGNWIRVNKKMMIKKETEPDNFQIWGADEHGFGRVFAVGDCAIVDDMNPIPKISYPSEEQAYIVCCSLYNMDSIVYDKQEFGCFGFGGRKMIHDTHWPWGSGMFATSLGPKDACFVIGATHQPGSGYMVLFGRLSAIQKELIEVTKVWECQTGTIGTLIWHFVHATPVHLWGSGPTLGY